MRLGLVLFVLAACPRTSETLPSGETRVIAVRGLEVRVLPRDTAGLVHAELFVDAGSRHATPPSAATIAAWASSTTLETRATPDFVSLRTEVEVESLPRALEAMAEGLATRSIEPETHARLVARWEDARRRAIAQPERRADALALSALLGPGANPLDGEVASIAQVEAFLADHFGASRALLVIVGDIDPDQAEARVRDAFAAAPRARESRPDAPALDGSALAREDGARTRATVAVDFPATHAALALGHRAHEIGLAQRVGVFPHAHGTTLLLRTRDLDALPSLRWIAAHAHAHQHPLRATRTAAEEAERVALDWRREDAAIDTRRVAVGLVCEADCTAPVAVEMPEPRVEAARAELTLPNGATVVAIRRRTNDVAWSVHLNSGGHGHGEVVVLAHALARRCGGRVRLDASGFSLNGSGARWRRELRATLDCMTRDVTNVAQDWTRALDGLRVAPERGWIAAALSPGLTSRVAPTGRLHEVAEAARAASRWPNLRVGARTRVAIVGDVQPRRAVSAVPILGVWPSGEEAREARWGDPVPMSPADWEDVARVVVGWRTDRGGTAAAVAGKAFARAAAERLRRHGAVLWQDGDGGEWGAWSAVALDVDATTLESLRAIASQSVDANPAREAREARRRAGDVQHVAWRAARGLPIVVEGDPSATLRALQSARPILVIGRPQNDAALRRWQRARGE